MLAKRHSSSKKQGFAALPKAKHRKVSSLGGSRRVPKGTALLPTEERTVRARDAANARWEKVRREKQVGQAINSAEDGRLKNEE